MPEIKHIKKLRNEKCLSINAITKRTGISWVTAKKYADSDQLPSEDIPKKRGMMYEEKWGEIVSDWLIEDAALKAKLRRNNKLIYLQLKELGFPGSYRTVCNFIAEWKDRCSEDLEEEKETFERLTHPPAEAQVDFGITEAIEDGKIKDIHCLIMSLPYSNGGFTVPLPGENQECFLEGLKILFKQLGAVPRKLRIDNLAAAVVKARGKHGETIFTDAFEQFASYYGFEAQACNARKGNEKGHVENKVGYVRYNYFTPSPVIQNLEHLGEMLFKQATKDHERYHYKKEQPIWDLINEEKRYCLALPDEPYPVFKKSSIKANKYGEISLDKELVHIPNSNHYSHLYLITYWDQYKVVSPHGELIGKGMRPYMNQAREIPWSSILKSWVRKPRAVTYSRYFTYLPGRIAAYLSIDSHGLRKERLEWVLSLITTHEMEEINEKFYEFIPNDYSDSRDSKGHPYEINWNMYDALRPSDSASERREISK